MKEKVLLGLSGGVDSAVTALLLKEQGYEVIGGFMRNYSDTKNKLTGDCNYLEDKKDAQKVAAMLNIPLKTFNFEKQYKDLVIDPMFKDYARGLTPNPDSLCNKIIKFPLLWIEAKKLGCKYIATGHYIKRKFNKKLNKFEVFIPKDESKDQSYFLYDLTQFDLKHTLFPIADLTKKEVREIAKKNNLHNFDKQGTRGICFVGKIDMKDFLEQKIKPKEGKIKDPEGNVVGKHNGIMYYTIGERIRENNKLIINKEYRNKTNSKLYIAKKITKSNTLVIAPYNHDILKNDKFFIRKIHFINPDDKNSELSKVHVRIRHLAELIPAKITKDKSFICNLKKGITALADGQSCVIYKGKRIIGGGEIRFS